MNKPIVIILTLILVIISVGGGLYYTKVYKPSTMVVPDENSIYIASGMKEKVKTGNRILLAELEEEDFHLYADGDYIILVHDNQEAEFTDWSENITKETPDMYYDDFNDDGNNELVIRALENVDENTGQSVYCLYALLISQDENGIYQYNVSCADRASWYPTYSNAVISEISQPVSYMNRLQIVMAASSSTISYDLSTGLSKNAERVWYSRALADEKGNNYTFDSWEKGPGIISLDKENNINVNIDVFAYYKETDEPQKIGVIRCGLTMEDSSFTIAKRSVFFVPEPSLTVTDPRSAAEEKWQYSFTNTASYSANDKTIDSLSGRFNLNKESRDEKVSFEKGTGEINALDKVVFADDSVKLYAKKGFAFSNQTIESGKYSVTIYKNGVLCNTALSASAGTENGTDVLTFTLDKSYPMEEIKEVRVNFGI